MVQDNKDYLVSITMSDFFHHVSKKIEGLGHRKKLEQEGVKENLNISKHCRELYISYGRTCKKRVFLLSEDTKLQALFNCSYSLCFNLLLFSLRLRTEGTREICLVRDLYSLNKDSLVKNAR